MLKNAFVSSIRFEFKRISAIFEGKEPSGITTVAINPFPLSLLGGSSASSGVEGSGLLPDSHLAVLDGREVVDEHINYEVDGEEFYLYPVIPEWCEVEK